ncbi:MAG: asparagine synthase (glutamine-hydrolyzing) [Croceibacterium sp.]
MCGITGYWSAGGKPDENLVRRMGEAIASRGPDGSGAWVDEQTGIALSHRRLAIIDLSAAGHQPMVSECGRFVLIFNGEIYNHLQLRRELETIGAAPEWRGHSDTETMLAAFAKWGIEGALHRFNGMFAFALWDRRERALTLARDRMGEKPLYYGHGGKTFFFGSELKSFRPHPDWSPEIDRNALADFLQYNYVPGPKSIYRGIRKLPAAHFVTIRNQGQDVGEPVAYWDIDDKARQPKMSGSAKELTDELEKLLLDSVKMRMASDVPLGAFLSGGIDSTIIAAMMQAQSDVPVRTFTIGFGEKAYNEAEHAKAIAQHLGTDHTELYVSAQDALDVIPKLPEIWDEPFADSSQIPTLLLSKLTRQHVTVSLSGDGGDELFCGYNRYVTGHAIWSKLARLPKPVRRSLAWGMLRTPKSVSKAVEVLLPKRFGVSNLPDRLPKLAEVLNVSDDRAYYRKLVSHWETPYATVIGADSENDWQSDWSGPTSILERMMLADMKTYLPDDILVKVDRASMAVSLEGRVPLLDHRVVEFALRTPLAMKYRDGQGKWLLREVLYRHVPREMMERPKMGFGVPIEEWLTGPLRPWAESLLDERRLRHEGFLDPAPIRKKWREHLSGERRWHYHLWDILMFQAWLEQQHQATEMGG